VFPTETKSRQKVINLATLHEGTPSSADPACNLSEENVSFLNWLFARAGLQVRNYRIETLQRRLPACLRALRVRSTAQARRLLEERPDLAPTALGSMLVGVTWFFRDGGVFDLLRDHVIPAALGTRKSVHAWSAGCSDGAELYSLALILAELKLLTHSYLLGTDCRSDAIERARTGYFESESLRHVPPPLLTRYFVPQTQGYQVTAAIRAALHWRTGDMLLTPEPGPWDLILCRNTAMYLRAEATKLLWEQLERLLRPGGVLVLGKAERPMGSKRLALVAACVYRRN
jgi:chemotaxis methyl-accepting protein methylase